MYLPGSFENTDIERSLALMREHPLATLVSSGDDGEPFVSHLPLIVERDEDQFVCIGHLARGNPHWRLLDGRTATAIFHGPNAYITPTWYAANSVPTWNYAVVHARGAVELIEDAEGVVGCLKTLVSAVETGPGTWPFWIPEDLDGRLEKAIVGFRLRVESLQAKFKLSQNRSATDRAGVLRGLATRRDPGSRGVLELMRQLDVEPP